MISRVPMTNMWAGILLRGMSPWTHAMMLSQQRLMTPHVYMGSMLQRTPPLTMYWRHQQRTPRASHCWTESIHSDPWWIASVSRQHWPPRSK
ncbi:ORF042R [giant sea perch iridovirus - K1]|uniref:ORF042R n=1 Tax=Giant seaperch iridovirus TaxID=176655 RepID=A0A140GB39_GSIV|nr:ORF042R [giant sea perch iridovirus - K1]